MSLASRLRIALHYARVWKKSRLPRVRIGFRLLHPCSYPHDICDYTAADERGDGAEAMGIGKMFSDPAIFAKLAANPRTAKHLADASFMQKVGMLCIRFQRPASYGLS